MRGKFSACYVARLCSRGSLLSRLSPSSACRLDCGGTFHFTVAAAAATVAPAIATQAAAASSRSRPAVGFLDFSRADAALDNTTTATGWGGMHSGGAMTEDRGDSNMTDGNGDVAALATDTDDDSDAFTFDGSESANDLVRRALSAGGDAGSARSARLAVGSIDARESAEAAVRSYRAAPWVYLYATLPLPELVQAMLLRGVLASAATAVPSGASTPSPTRSAPPFATDHAFLQGGDQGQAVKPHAANSTSRAAAAALRSVNYYRQPLRPIVALLTRCFVAPRALLVQPRLLDTVIGPVRAAALRRLLTDRMAVEEEHFRLHSSYRSMADQSQCADDASGPRSVGVDAASPLHTVARELTEALDAAARATQQLGGQSHVSRRRCRENLPPSQLVQPKGTSGSGGGRRDMSHLEDFVRHLRAGLIVQYEAAFAIAASTRLGTGEAPHPSEHLTLQKQKANASSRANKDATRAEANKKAHRKRASTLPPPSPPLPPVVPASPLLRCLAAHGLPSDPWVSLLRGVALSLLRADACIDLPAITATITEAASWELFPSGHTGGTGDDWDAAAAGGGYGSSDGLSSSSSSSQFSPSPTQFQFSYANLTLSLPGATAQVRAAVWADLLIAVATEFGSAPLLLHAFDTLRAHDVTPPLPLMRRATRAAHAHVRRELDWSHRLCGASGFLPQWLQSYLIAATAERVHALQVAKQTTQVRQPADDNAVGGPATSSHTPVPVTDTSMAVTTTPASTESTTDVARSTAQGAARVEQRATATDDNNGKEAPPATAAHSVRRTSPSAAFTAPPPRQQQQQQQQQQGGQAAPALIDHMELLAAAEAVLQQHYDSDKPRGLSGAQETQGTTGTKRITASSAARHFLSGPPDKLVQSLVLRVAAAFAAKQQPRRDGQQQEQQRPRGLDVDLGGDDHPSPIKIEN